MKQSLVKIIDVILKRLEEHSPESLPSETGLRSWLVRQGYKKPDIDAAMRFVATHLRTRPKVRSYQPQPARQLSALEEYKLTPEARDGLARLEHYGLIDAAEREMLLDRLDHFEGEIGMGELDYLVAWLICSTRDYESQQTILSVMENQDMVFH
ncbi:MAG: hypothetical protein AMXMBFR84_32760 [Candidatus Hydrogenedentota bacterium]